MGVAATDSQEKIFFDPLHPNRSLAGSTCSRTKKLLIKSFNHPVRRAEMSTTRTAPHLAVLATVAGAAALLTACGTMHQPASTFSQASLPAPIQVPAGHKVAWETVGSGDITYECKDKAGMPGQTEWVFVGPEAVLKSRAGKAVGRYFGPPATWVANDGSKLTATQLAVAPSGPGNLPYQLVKANPAMGSGELVGVSYIQRVALQGGVAPADKPCTDATKGQKAVVKYQADYIFWKPM
jgi:hypothetical protein